MLLTIDVGNSNTVFAVMENNIVVQNWRCATDNRRTGDEYYVWLSTLLEESASRPIENVVIASVVPNAMFHLKRLCRKYFKLEPLIVGSSNCRLPVEPRVDKGAHVGTDRLVNAAAAFDLYGGNLIVVDFGTATTFDVVAEDGAYIGGSIAPGVELSVKVLHEAAAALPLVEVARPKMVVGSNTRDCLYSGIYWGYLGMIEGICRRIQNELDQPMKVIGTGGLANLFGLEKNIFDHVNSNLTVLGLALIYQFNRN